MPAAGLSAAALIAFDAMTASGVVPEVISRSESPHAYDWRTASAEVQVAIGQDLEENNFNSATYELALGLPNDAGSMLRLGLRRAEVFATPSSDKIGRSPFVQASLSNRYELFAGYAIGLVEGRAMTRLSTTLPDVENATFFWLGAHYSHPNATWIPRRDDPADPYPGQNRVNSSFVLELGLRWQVYLPQNFGLMVEAMDNRPLGNTAELRHWIYLDGGVVWSMGGQK